MARALINFTGKALNNQYAVAAPCLSVSSKRNCEHGLSNVEMSDYPHHTTSDAKKNPDEQDGEWDLKLFQKKLKIEIIKEDVDENYLEFDIIGIDCAIANSFRRIMLAEVPTMAIEKVHFYLNTSVFQEEFLAHRLGLIPIKADAKLFDYPANVNDLDGRPEDTIIFEMKVKCIRNPNPPKNSVLPDDLYLNRRVYSKQFKWIPIGEQEQQFKNDPPKPVLDDILIGKLTEGQEFDLKLHCCKGIGRDHAKFSPVCTASYRLHPYIKILQTIKGEDAKIFRKCFSKNVIKLANNGVAYVDNERFDSTSRNVFLYPQFKDKVRLGLKKDHFIFTIESTGAIKPSDIFVQSIDILLEKCKKHLDELKTMDT